METPHFLHQVDTRDTDSVCAAVAEIAWDLFGQAASPSAIEQLFLAVQDMFEGRFVYFQRIDVGYHNLEHTLQAALCWARLFRNYHCHGEPGLFTIDHFRIGLAAVLLHDVGYLKEEHDARGSGAKFAPVHERRSCELAQISLSILHWSEEAILMVQNCISCTGLRATIATIPFRNRVNKVLGQMVATADYLSQLSDPDYLEKLPGLFEEFEEADRFHGIPPEKRLYRTALELKQRTPLFWHQQVLPRLEYDCDGLFHYLAEPYPDGPNPYLLAVQQNLERVRGSFAPRPSAPIPQPLL